jgi:hypothetical protein
MKPLRPCFTALLVASSVFAQTSAVSQRRVHSAKAAAAVTPDELTELKQMLQAQQQQLQQMQQQMAERDRQLQQLQQELNAMHSAGSELAAKAGAANTTATQASQSAEGLQTDVKDLRLKQQNAAVSAKEDQKKAGEAAAMLSRFRWSGDIRVRNEDFFQGFSGCVAPACNPRIRERIRVRLALDGKLNDDFIGGLAIATGAQTDPTTTNETLTGMFERKSFYLDRGYIAYTPQNHKWLNLTGGKFAYTWTRTSMTFDPDINPEGFSQKLSWDVSNSVLKSVSVQGMQLLFNEVSKGADSFAAGGQFGARLQLGKFWILSPTYTILNWRNPDSILTQAFPVVTPNPITTCTGAVCTNTTAPFANNGQTNASFKDAKGVSHYTSGFLYSDLILNNSFTTPWQRAPINLTAEYLQNLNARTPVGAPDPQDKAYLFDVNLGRQKSRGDWQIGYGWWRQEQDSAIAAFNESDQRQPTNILQNKVYFNYKLRGNVTTSYTQYIGRILNTNLTPGLRGKSANPGTSNPQDPYLNRFQFDLIYAF